MPKFHGLTAREVEAAKLAVALDKRDGKTTSAAVKAIAEALPTRRILGKA